MRTVLLAPVSLRTWRETAHLLLGAVVAALAAVVVVATAYSLVASITVVGLALLAVVIVAARSVYLVERLRARYLLGLDVPAPPPMTRRHPGVVGWARDALADPVGWRSVLYGVFAVPLGLAQAYLVAAWWALSTVLLTSQVWSRLAPRRVEFGLFGVSGYADEWRIALPTAAVGLAGVLVAPWLVRGLANLDRQRIRLLAVRPDPAVSERRRANAVRQSGSQLRRLERDLHDGAQARMVALALELGRAREELASGQRPVRDRGQGRRRPRGGEACPR